MARSLTHRLRNIFARNGNENVETGLSTNWTEFREKLAQVREDGHAISYAEFNASIVGIGAPIFNSEDAIPGSVANGGLGQVINQPPATSQIWPVTKLASDDER